MNMISVIAHFRRKFIMFSAASALAAFSRNAQRLFPSSSLCNKEDWFLISCQPHIKLPAWPSKLQDPRGPPDRYSAGSANPKSQP